MLHLGSAWLKRNKEEREKREQLSLAWKEEK